MIRYVNSAGLNLRETPDTSRQPRRLLRAGEALEIVTPTMAEWVEVETRSFETGVRGFVNASYLRDALSPAREALIAAALVQWWRFDFGKGKENTDPYAGFVGEMWTLVGHPERTGRDRKFAWSAAAISYIVDKAGDYSGFRRAPLHATYVNQAVRARSINDAEASFWGYRHGERAPEPGDIVAAPRPHDDWNVTATYELAMSGQEYPSHCDIVMAVRGDTLVMLGGNVSDSVFAKTVTLHNGRLPQTYFALLKNRR